MEGNISKLDELADKSANKNGGNPAHYIHANQALRDDIFAFISAKTDKLLLEILNLKTKLELCETKLSESETTEIKMLQHIASLENKLVYTNSQTTSKNDFFLVGSSILRDVHKNDLLNGTVTSISGGVISDVKETIKKLDFNPKTIITQIGGNDLENKDETVESVTEKYVTMLTETKEKHPESKLIVTGLPPRFRDNLIRTKVKDFNDRMKTWSDKNEIQYVSTDEEFELRSGEVDSSAYIMTGDMPKLHLNREGTIRMLKHIQKQVPNLKLADMNSKEAPSKSYANAVKFGNKKDTTPQHRRQNNKQDDFTRNRRSRGCFNCAETNHTVSQCKYGQKVKCHRCHKMGHKEKFCDY